MFVSMYLLKCICSDSKSLQMLHLWSKFHISPGWVAQLVEASFCAPKGCRLCPWSGHIPILRVQSYHSAVHCGFIKYFVNALCILFLFLLNLLGWHWLIKLYMFQVYNSTIHHLYIVLCVHHPNSSFFPSPFIPSLPSSTCLHPLSIW